MGSNSSYTHTVQLPKRKGSQRAQHAIEKSNLWSGEFQENGPSAESCFVKLRWKEAIIILCFFPFLLSHEVFQQLLLRNKYKAAPTGGDGLSEGLATLARCLQTFPGILAHLKTVARKMRAVSECSHAHSLL